MRKNLLYLSLSLGCGVLLFVFLDCKGKGGFKILLSNSLLLDFLSSVAKYCLFFAICFSFRYFVGLIAQTLVLLYSYVSGGLRHSERCPAPASGGVTAVSLKGKMKLAGLKLLVHLVILLWGFFVGTFAGKRFVEIMDCSNERCIALKNTQNVSKVYNDRPQAGEGASLALAPDIEALEECYRFYKGKLEPGQNRLRLLTMLALCADWFGLAGIVWHSLCIFGMSARLLARRISR